MDDSRTEAQTGSEATAGVEETAALRDEVGRLRDLLAERDQRIAGLRDEITLLRDEIRALKNLPKRPRMKPSGMAAAVEAAKSGTTDGKGKAGKGRKGKRPRGSRRRHPKAAQRDVRIELEHVPDGAVFKGYETRRVHDITFRAEEVRVLRAVWETPDGCRHVAPMPEGLVCGREQYGLGVKAFVLTLYHQGQSTVNRITTLLNDAGLAISKRTVQRMLNEDAAGLVAEAREVLKAGLASASWIAVDDTGARHGARNGYCTVIGNEAFTHFRSSEAKTRLNFFDHLNAGDERLILNEAAFAHMRRLNLSGTVIRTLADHPRKLFPDRASWIAHLDALGISALTVTPDPVRGTTESARWGTVVEGGRLDRTVILSDDAGQFNAGDRHALCWVHSERLIHKLFAGSAHHQAARDDAKARVWSYYALLLGYQRNPSEKRRKWLSTRFDTLFKARTGHATLDRLLESLIANKAELLRVLDHPDIPLSTNIVERDIRAHVTRRKLSAGTRSEPGRQARDAGLGILKTCGKLGVSFSDYLADRFGMAGAPAVPKLADLIVQRSTA